MTDGEDARVDGGGAAVIVLDDDLAVRSAGPGVHTLLGYEPAELVGQAVTVLVDPEDHAAVRAGVERLAADTDTPPLLTRLCHRDGSPRWVELWLSDLRADHAVAGIVARLRDVTEHHHADQALRASERLYRSIVENADQGICLFDFAGFITLANAHLADMLGYQAHSLIGVQVMDLVHPDDRARGMAFRRRRLAGKSERGELRLQRRDGAPLDVLLGTSPLEGPDGEPLGALAMVTDISEQKRAEHRLARDAMTDPLTGLANRALLFDRLEHALAAAQRHGSEVAVAFFDVDHFKLVNDSIGHAAGDTLLRTLAQRLSAGLRSADTTVARLGGDEFVVLCETVTARADVEAVTTRIHATASEPMTIAGRQLQVAVSIGLAFGPPGDAQTLLGNADAAMYQAKRRGRACTVVFDEGLGTAERRSDLLGALGGAVMANQLQLRYQPIVTLADNHVVAAEALTRWHHPARDVLYPAVFLRAAEDSSVIVDIDGWALSAAATQAGRWADAGHLLPVAVNLSARSLAAADVVEVVHAAVTAADLDPKLLVLEVTERALLPDADNHRGVLRRLHELGIQIAIDSFATGHSSLTVLSHLPADGVKIDRTVVARLPGPAERSVAATIGAATALGMSVTAVGVETTAQRDLLYELGCDAGQGFLWSAAVAAAQVPPSASERDEALAP